MTGFEPRSSGVSSDRCATTRVPTKCTFGMFLLNWAIPRPVFSILWSFQYSWKYIKFANDRIRTADLRNLKQSLYQLSHNWSKILNVTSCKVSSNRYQLSYNRSKILNVTSCKVSSNRYQLSDREQESANDALLKVESQKCVSHVDEEHCAPHAGCSRPEKNLLKVRLLT